MNSTQYQTIIADLAEQELDKRGARGRDDFAVTQVVPMPAPVRAPTTPTTNHGIVTFEIKSKSHPDASPSRSARLVLLGSTSQHAGCLARDVQVSIRYLSRPLPLQSKHLGRLNEIGRFVPELTVENLVDEGSVQISRSQVEGLIRFLINVGPCLGARNKECIDLLRERNLTTINDQRSNDQSVLASIDNILVVHNGSEHETIRDRLCELLSGCVPCANRQKMLPAVIERLRAPKPTPLKVSKPTQSATKSSMDDGKDKDKLTALQRTLFMYLDEVTLTATLLMKRNGEVLGFADSDAAIMAQDNPDQLPLATMGLALMVRSLGGGRPVPLMYFLQAKSCANFMRMQISRAIRTLKMWGLRVIIVSSDGGSVNKSAFCKHLGFPHARFHWIPDFTHVFKNLRNNLHNRGRILIPCYYPPSRYYDKLGYGYADWEIVEVYVTYLVSSRSGYLGPTRRPLSLAHIKLDGRSKMNVGLAVGIFNSDFVRTMRDFFFSAENRSEYPFLPKDVEATCHYIGLCAQFYELFTVRRPVDAERLTALAAIKDAFTTWSAHHDVRVEHARTELTALKDMAAAQGRASSTGAGTSKKGAAVPDQDAQLKNMIEEQEAHVKDVENEWISNETAGDIVTCIAVATEVTKSLFREFPDIKGHLYLRMFGTNCVEALFSTCRQLSGDNEQVRVTDLSLAFGLMDRLVCFSDLIRRAKRSYLYPEEDEEGEDD
ncbi:hypothetical protein BCR44DRAFT_28406 [Catenaria anguillulae PL171]|uniref:Transposable element P transposase-like RNase H domain-containing protein n=1 Tax=Catenaria anguillulae PL171 TaxID=765915 RepID=A0A1Y2HQ86_9FUNG|nr:hypothetical protein BCR44DRAFT_28406 [Catenaria anguillulae PL171]